MLFEVRTTFVDLLLSDVGAKSFYLECDSSIAHSSLHISKLDLKCKNYGEPATTLMAERVLLAFCEEFLSKQVEVRLLNEGKKWSKI